MLDYELGRRNPWRMKGGVIHHVLQRPVCLFDQLFDGRIVRGWFDDNSYRACNTPLCCCRRCRCWLLTFPASADPFAAAADAG